MTDTATTTDPNQPSTGSAADYAANNPIPGGTPTQSASYAAPIGVGYQINQSNGPVLIDYDTGQVTNYDGTSVVGTNQKVVQPGQVMTGKNGDPLPYAAQVEAPLPLAHAAFSVATGGSAFGIKSVPAQYREGQEFQEYGALPPELQQQVNQMFRDKGLVPKTGPVSLNAGVGAMKQVMAQANASGTDWKTALQQMPTQPASVTKTPVQVKLSNPEDLAAVFHQAAAQVLGHDDIPQDQVDNFVRAYQAMERSDQESQIAQQDAIDRQATGTNGPAPGTDIQGANLPDSALGATAVAPIAQSPGGTPEINSTAPPSASQFALDQLKKTHPGEAGGTALAHQMDQFLSILSSPGGAGGTTGSTT